jgi:hypothetical protein
MDHYDPSVNAKLLPERSSRGGPAMEVATIRDRCQDHADAMVAGDLNRAAEDLSESGKADAAEVMKAIPRRLDSAKVLNVSANGDGAEADIVYTGEGRDVTVRSSWSEIDGHPYITKLTLV